MEGQSQPATWQFVSMKKVHLQRSIKSPSYRKQYQSLHIESDMDWQGLSEARFVVL